MYDVITIAGSPSSLSRSTAVLAYVRQVLERQGLRTWGINVRDLPAADLLHANFDSPIVQEQIALVLEARSVVVATPIYKAAYSGVLKTFLDLLPQQALSGKPVLAIATGGSLAHMLAIDYALRPVLTALGAQHILASVFVPDAQVQYTAESVQLDPAVATRLDSAVAALSDTLGQKELVW